jgi:hypothetical protein
MPTSLAEANSVVFPHAVGSEHGMVGGADDGRMGHGGHVGRVAVTFSRQ